MGIDTNVWLKVRDRAALREALEAYAEKDRRGFIDNGREADYEAQLAEGYDPKPLIRPLPDGNVSIFTGHRFEQTDMEYTIRCWLADHFGDALAHIHDDPRGVFVSPDICAPRAKTYDGIVRELAGAGRFIDPSPPTDEEHEAHRRAADAYSEGMTAVREAQEAGDEDALSRALAAAPQEVRDVFARQEAMSRRFDRGGRFTGEITADEEVTLSAPELAQLKKVMERMTGAPIAGSPTADALGEMFGLMFEAKVNQSAKEMRDDPRGFGRGSMLLPPEVAKALTDTVRLDVQERTELQDGSVILVTSNGDDEAIMEAVGVAESLPASFDRAEVGLLPFFRESLTEEIASASTFDEAKRLLGDRAELLPLQTWDEHAATEKKNVSDWLDEV